MIGYLRITEYLVRVTSNDDNSTHHESRTSNTDSAGDVTEHADDHVTSSNSSDLSANDDVTANTETTAQLLSYFRSRLMNISIIIKVEEILSCDINNYEL